MNYNLILVPGVYIKLQEKLLHSDSHSLKPDTEFLGLFSGVVDSNWPSLAASLSLSESEIKKVKREGGSEGDQALRMLSEWVRRKEATYGLLCKTLKTISLFECVSK